MYIRIYYSTYLDEDISTHTTKLQLLLHTNLQKVHLCRSNSAYMSLNRQHEFVVFALYAPFSHLQGLCT